ncbi:MAG: MBL fold metallo-hydrolase [Candidatus Heimdallarchaeota archaeon]|nr:MBL fold metallo-hydrolase [Candidatus Heimdallarchaeota archaeon]MBY8994912.1 MBL fold metallo-hydrolase [Candidatus Heimdallarchaeota archaeon]
MTYEKIIENVYAITDGSTRGNVAAFVLPSEIIFVDSGMSLPIIKKFREELEKETGKKVSTLVITHTHGDHVFGNQIFKDCRIIASKHTKERMVSSKANDWTLEKMEEWKKTAEDPTALEGLEIVLPTETFENTIELEDFDKKIIIKNTGGHTAGSSYVYYPEAKALIAGDNLFIGSFPWAGDQSANPQKWIDTFKEYLSLDVEYFIPGHGSISTKAEVQEYLDYFDKVVVLMRKMITQGFSEDRVVEKANEIEFHPPRRETWKETSLRKWYQVLSQK